MAVPVGCPQIESNGIKTSMTGYSNLVRYDFVVYPVRSESGFRPYLAGGAGVKVYTGTGFRFVGLPPTAGLALLRRSPRRSRRSASAAD
jgi:hypothetical protein